MPVGNASCALNIMSCEITTSVPGLTPISDLISVKIFAATKTLYTPIVRSETLKRVLLWLVHTANTDKTRLSCLVSSAVWTEFATAADSFQYVGDRTVLSCLWCERIWEQDKTQFTPRFETGQNCFEIFSRRQSRLVSNSVHTANTDNRRQDCLVLSVFAVWTSH